MTKLPFGTALALAQRTLAAPLAAVLVDENVAMPEWFTLNVLGLRGPIGMAALADLLATDGPPAAEVVAAMTAAGLVDVRDDMVALTPAGAARYAGLRDRIGAVTARIFEEFDPERVAATHGLLEEIAAIDPAALTRRTVPAP
jgi:DNA-binding MarR family transcriptional regulator